MSPAEGQEAKIPFPLKLHRLLADVGGLWGILDILKLYVDHFEIFGASLWEVAEGVGRDRKGRMFLQSQYFASKQKPRFYHLPIDSTNGRCLQSGREAVRQRVKDGWIEVTYPERLDDLGVSAVMILPVQLKHGAGKSADATITFYSKLAFTPENMTELRDAALLFPFAYRFVQEHASLAILRRVQEILRTARFSQASDPQSGAQNALDQVIGIISQYFQFLEVGIYLHDPITDPPGHFSRAAECWPWREPSKSSYRSGEGATGWVLQNGAPLRFVDLARYEEDREYYRQRYDGLEWVDRYGIEKAAREAFKIQEGDELFPLSFACLPIVYEGVVTGALRFGHSREGPFHVDEDVMRVLSSVADMIADWWDHWVREQSQHTQSRTASSTMSLLGAANRYVIQNWHPSPSLDKIVSYFLEICQKSVPQADVIELWIQDPQRKSLKREGALSSRHGAGTVFLQDSRGAKKRDAFRDALHPPSVVHVPDPAQSNLSLPNGRGIACYTLAPVITDARCGILLLASTRLVAWPDAVSVAAASLAEQLALYFAFHRQISGLNEAQNKLESSVREQAQLLLDFQHQLRTPISIAKNSVDSLTVLSPNGAEWKSCFAALTASTLRARTIANNLRFFVSLAQGNLVAAQNKLLEIDPVLEGVEQASRYVYNRGALGKQITFDIKRQDPLHTTPQPRFFGDPNLIALAADNLLDNAVKYSYNDTSVMVEAGGELFGKQVYFSFRNQGLPVKAEEIPAIIQRGRRGDKATVSSPEGTGIGLWMVAEMMRAMDGRLEIQPTDDQGWNDFRLCFRGSPA
jgi:signal transduction histidine kinase